MAEQKEGGISWCDYTFNPWIGCQKVSPACSNCYAERDFDHRYKKAKWGPNGTRVITSTESWKKPIRWNREYELHRQEIWENHGPMLRRPRVFCASLADVFEDWQGPIRNSHGETLYRHHDSRQDGWIAYSDDSNHQGELWTMNDVRRKLFALIDATPNLDWLLLTKRPENIRRMLHGSIPKLATALGEEPGTPEANIWYRPNLWLGTSVENQEYADKRVPELLKCRDLSPVLFLSCEPLLGPVDLTMIATKPPYEGVDALGGQLFDCVAQETRDYPKVDWVITGGESGPNARPSHPNWFRFIRDQCKASGVAFHHKQNGEWVPTRQARHSDLSSDAAKQVIMRPDGVITTGFLEYGIDAVVMDRVGKKQAGRLLDGQLHDAFPVVR